MRLTKIKLAGFKSFVDPTGVQFPSNLVGVVGPNGCGKSNIIDAVRWVLGEISAKHLRGDSMADVVFNGSSSRKPVGSASVELVFDNSDGTLGGEYAAFSEVSLKRVVSRDGTSNYFLNGSRCRRKDITQLFLGTGLGSRSYAIIEQNMISRVIDARADEMRGFLEEAAGISRYKERRRETETRIAHTRENLDRLNDLREEVDKQLRHLQRQAATARRYQALKQDERQLAGELLALRLAEISSEAGARQAVHAERENALQAALAEQRSHEAAIERERLNHAAASEALAKVQGTYYQVGSEISRAEQAIEHSHEIRRRQREELAQLGESLRESQELCVRDQEQLRELAAALAELQPALESARADEQKATEALGAAEEGMHDWQERWESFNQALRGTSSQVGAERARIEQLDHQLRRLLSQRERAEQETEGLAAADVAGRLGAVEGEEGEARTAVESARARLAQATAALGEARQRERDLGKALDEVRRGVQDRRGQIVSLEALQRAALGLGQGKIVDWLQARGLDAQPRLAQQLGVETGWDRAVETVLGGYLEAVCVDSIDDVAGLLDTLSDGTVTFFAPGQGPVASGATGDSLRAKVRGPGGLDPLFEGIVAADTLGAALALRPSLRPGQSVITRDGIWIGPDWLRVSRDKDAHAGVIEREHALRVQRASLEDGERSLAAAEATLQAARDRVRDLEDGIASGQSDVATAGSRHMNLRAQLDGLRARAEQRNARMTQLAAELAELVSEIESASAEVRLARGRLDEALSQLAELDGQRTALETERDGLRERLGVARAAADVRREAVREAAIRFESRRAAQSSLEAGVARLVAQIGQSEARRIDLESQVESGAAAEQERRTALGQWLEQRVVIERELGAAREAMEAADTSLRALDERRLVAEAAVGEARELLDTVRYAVQELKVRRESLLEQFALTRLELTAVTQALPAEATVGEWEHRVAEVTDRIEKLGQVNLAAIDEFQQQSERKEYLDRQLGDLNDALATLEESIRKIDRETKTRFQDTFDRVNTGLKEKFPRLFGGGHAYLELTGTDVLDAGVAIMARPPGKRNVTIAQLSGGEKALTAVALVFSIFELNPAPFCLLDEVDAPLDDNNVGRFCDIVREMSERVQFIFITHNKATMEMANQLLGVTMQEPGVSRIVAVDVDEAVRMAAM